MAKKKLAGKERPYTWGEFLEIIKTICKEQKVVMSDELDYFLVDSRMRDLSVKCEDDMVFSLISVTAFGGSEGVYSDFYVTVYDKRRHVFTAKTLCEDNSAYIKMHEFAARVCVIAFDYFNEHRDEFNWSGYNVGYWDGDKRVLYMIGHERESALSYAEVLKKRGYRAWIRDNGNRKYQEV